MKSTLTSTALTLGAAGIAAAAGLLGTTPVAHADDQSYLNYIKARGQSMLPIAEGPLVAAGYTACGHLRTGETPAQVAQHFLDPSLTPPQLVVEAAQHELCPDRL
jgi:hypothetical protein